MLATWVPAKLTPLTFDEAAEAMRSALTKRLGSEPSREVLALALGKTALETGRWQSLWCQNWGNIKAGASYVGSYFCIELNEVLGGKVVWFSPRGRLDRRGGNVIAEPFNDPPGHPQTRMRAYGSATEGAHAYVEFVAGGRYAAAWLRLLAGDAMGYVRLLKSAGYFTADEAIYARSVTSLQREFVARLASPPVPARPPKPPITPPRRTLRQGMAGDDVRDLQARLNAAVRELAPLTEDGNFGPATSARLRIFQIRNGLVGDGVAGPATLSKLLSGAPLA